MGIRDKVEDVAVAIDRLNPCKFVKEEVLKNVYENPKKVMQVLYDGWIEMIMKVYGMIAWECVEEIKPLIKEIKEKKST